MADLLETLQQLTGSSQDLGGGAPDARALSQLIMSGGSMSVEGQPLFGGPAPDPIAEAATQAEMGGFGRKPDAELAKAIREGRVNPADILDRPVSAPTQKQWQPLPGGRGQILANVVNPEAAPEQRPAGTYTSGRNLVPLNPQFQRTLDTAKEIADSLTPSGRTERLRGINSGDFETFQVDAKTGTPFTRSLPNPYGPGSYNPDNPDEVAKVKAQAEESAKLDKVKNFLSGDFLSKLPPGAPVKEIIAGLLESVGVVKGEEQKAREVARGTAQGQIEGGKGPAAIPPGLAASAGTPEFLDRMAAEGARLPAAQQLALERLHDQRVKQKTPEEKLVTSYENAQSSIRRLNKVADLYDVATKNGSSVSKNLKLAMGQNTTWTAFLQNKLIPVTDSFTDDEASFVAEMNSLLIGMRQLYDDNRMSDQDVKNALKAMGNPATGPDLYRKQVAATTGVVKERGEAIRRSLTIRGKDTTGLVATPDRGAAPAAAPNQPQVGTVSRGYRFIGGDPSKPESWEKQ